MLIRTAVSGTRCLSTITPLLHKGKQINFQQLAFASTSLSNERKTNQQERAIRVKSQQRARIRRIDRDPQNDASQVASKKSNFRKQSRPKSSSERQKGINSQDSTYSVRDHRYRVAKKLMDLFYEDISATTAFKKAEEMVNAMPPFSRRSTYIYNAYIRHAARAGKGKGSLSIFQDMKKNGVAPNLESFRSIFMGMEKLKIHAKRDSNLIASLIKIFDELEQFWFDAIRYKEGIKFSDLKEDETNEEVEGNINSQKESTNKEGAQHTNTTPASYKSTQFKGYEEALTNPIHFYETVNAYLQTLLKSGMREQGADLVLRSPLLNKPVWSKSENQFAPGLMATLSKSFLAFQENSDGGKHEKKSDWSRALEFSQESLKDAKGIKASQALENEKVSRRWQVLQNRGKMSLALTKDDMREMFGEDMEGGDDGPPGLDKKDI